MYAWSMGIQKAVAHKYPEDKKLAHLISCMEITKEITEVLDCVPWKFSRHQDKGTREHLLEELVDVYNFFMKLLGTHDVTPEEFYEAWEKKRTIIEDRLL